MRCLADAFSPRGTHRPVSGSGLSEDERFSYGYSSVCGKRASMEDFYDARISKIDGKVVGMFGVFDGHGGAHAAKYVQRYLFDNLTSHPEFVSDPRLAIQEAYEQTDRNFLKDEEMDDGSTASTAVLVGDRLLVANLGDSRAVLCKAGEALALSTDHKPDRTDERQRIEDAGGCVIHVGTWRVGGVLAVSRAFGDRTLKKYVSAVPEIQEERITDDVDFLVLASDGLWDVVTNEGAVALVQSIADPEEAAKRLTTEAYEKGSLDNITCIVVRFLRNTQDGLLQGAANGLGKLKIED